MNENALGYVLLLTFGVVSLWLGVLQGFHPAAAIGCGFLAACVVLGLLKLLPPLVLGTVGGIGGAVWFGFTANKLAQGDVGWIIFWIIVGGFISFSGFWSLGVTAQAPGDGEGS
jgi:hypothetical protein